MPFQVIFSINNQPRIHPLKIILNPASITVICQSYVTLPVQVVNLDGSAANLTGHTLEWEQLTGSAVSWVGSHFVLNPQYSQSQTDDKSFQFWVDRGTAYEATAILWVWGAPTEQKSILITAGSESEMNRFLQAELPTVWFSAAVPTTSGASFNPTSLTINWSVPSPQAPNSVYSVTVEQNNTGTFVPIYTTTNLNITDYGGAINNNASYRVRVTYRTIGRTYYSAVSLPVRPIIGSGNFVGSGNYIFADDIKASLLSASLASELATTRTYRTRVVPTPLVDSKQPISASLASELTTTRTYRTRVVPTPSIDIKSILIAASLSSEFAFTRTALSHKVIG